MKDQNTLTQQELSQIIEQLEARIKAKEAREKLAKREPIFDFQMIAPDRPRTSRTSPLLRAVEEDKSPSPERTFIAITDYLLRSDDPKFLLALSQIAFLDKRVLAIVHGMIEITQRYGVRSGDSIVISTRRILEEGGERELRRCLAIMRSYNLLEWIIRTSPVFSRIVEAMISHIEYPTVTRQIQDSLKKYSGSTLEISEYVPGQFFEGNPEGEER